MHTQDLALLSYDTLNPLFLRGQISVNYFSHLAHKAPRLADGTLSTKIRQQLSEVYKGARRRELNQLLKLMRQGHSQLASDVSRFCLMHYGVSVTSDTNQTVSGRVARRYQAAFTQGRAHQQQQLLLQVTVDDSPNAIEQLLRMGYSRAALRQAYVAAALARLPQATAWQSLDILRCIRAIDCAGETSDPEQLQLDLLSTDEEPLAATIRGVVADLLARLSASEERAGSAVKPDPAQTELSLAG